MIPLYLAALFASYLASELVVTKFFGLSTGTYTHYFRLYLPPIDIFYSFLKAMVFAVLVTFVHCYYGYNASGGPAGVGVAAGRAIRLSIILVVVVNLFMSLDPLRRRQRNGQVGRMRRLGGFVGQRRRALGLVSGTVMLVRLANGDFAGDYTLSGTFPSAGEGLHPGSAVVFRGVQVGRVSTISLYENQAQVTLSSNPIVPGAGRRRRPRSSP